MEPTEPASNSPGPAHWGESHTTQSQLHVTNARDGPRCQEETAGDKPNPPSPLGRPPHPAQGPPGLVASSPYMPLAPLPCSSLSRSQGCPHQEYLLTRLALLATLTTNMLSDKVGRKKVLELKTMSEIILHPHQVRVRWGLQTGHTQPA